tara:strand:+ start:15716 stop:15994 length:279 start_codon:yes stop_codon:yes gene_type:complete
MNDKIIKLIEERIEIGKREYADQLDVNDGRDWVKESLEEMLDGMVYISAELLKIQQNRGGCSQCKLNHKLNGLMKKYSLKKLTEILADYQGK